jgi:hypothetical protein
MLQPAPEALGQLLRAFLLAHRLGEDRWQFAINLPSLHQVGLDDTYLRWLIRQGYVEHRLERTEPDADRREFQDTRNLGFTTASCFVLTEHGRAFAQSSSPRSLAAAAGPRAAATVVPLWDGDRRLYVEGAVVKYFHQKAPAQKKILCALQEEGWPTWVLNPLTRNGERTPEDRLHDAVNKLNRGQRNRRIHFYVEGGERVCWELLPEKPSGTQATRKRHPSGV